MRTNRARRAAALAVTLAVALLGLPGGAAADCSGPSIQVMPTAGPAGTSITVTGQAFGTNCYDTGPPPPGQGILGEPQTDIEISVTDASFIKTVLGTVDADADYAFTFETAIPGSAVVGPASVQAQSAGTPFVAPVEFEVQGEVIPATPAFTG